MYREDDDMPRHSVGFDQYGNPYGFNRGNDVYYRYDGKHYTEDELIDFADTMAHYDMQDSGELIGIRNIDEAIDFLGDDEVEIVDGSNYGDGGMMAKGGGVDEFHWKNTKHGTLLYSKNEYQGISITKNSEGRYYVTADEGYRFYNDFEPIEVDTMSQAKAYANKEISYKMADGGYMAKGGVHKVNKKYDYFAVNKKTNKIVDGWEIVDDVESLKYYAKMDLKDNDYDPKDYNLLSAKTLKARGIDPYSWDSWAKTGEYADGGYMAKGGEVKYKKGDKLKKHGIIWGVFIDTPNAFENQLLNVNSKTSKTDLKKLKTKASDYGWNTIERWLGYAIDDEVDYYEFTEKVVDELVYNDTLSRDYEQNESKGDSILIVKFDGRKKYYIFNTKTKKIVSDRMFASKKEAQDYMNTKMAKGGMPKFEDKVDAISDSLEGTSVKPKYRKEYGKTYSKKESVEAAKRIAGAMRKKEMSQKKS